MGDKDILTSYVDAWKILVAFGYLDFKTMDITDKLGYISDVLKVAEILKPYVDKYGGDPEELMKKIEEVSRQRKIKNFLEIMKGINDGSTEGISDEGTGK